MHAAMTPAQLKRWFDSKEFEQQYHYAGRLGAWLEDEKTHFALWAPTAERVQLYLYPDGDVSAALRIVEMTRGEKGVWLYQAAEKLSGIYYDYDVTVDGETQRTQDPYAKACGVNGVRSMVVNPSDTDPAGWMEDHAPPKAMANIIYEIHIKDFSWDAHSGVPEKIRGKYAALTLTDTTLDGKGDCPTCLHHAKNLGVTHIQLMPVYDYGSVDEKGDPDAFNWGYDPVNYNVPEGSYASDACNGLVRIRELKEAIQAMHRAGFRVIMDVVYNHTYQLKESCLFKTVPWYFYRQDEEGNASNGSGCGSEIASERSMVSRYILDSLLYWAEEYHMDGFRFDLMGMLDVELMNRIQDAMDDRFGKGEKLLYGEPWAGGQCHPRPGTELAHKGNMKKLHPAIGAFCDNTRDGIKGSVMDELSRGFVNGGGLDAVKLSHCIRAWAGEYGDFAAPTQTITYLSSHDDWTLWDKLVCTLDEKRDFTGLNEKILRANRLAFAMLSICQGHLFLLSGEEFGRTKEGVKNSYCSPVAINRMDWQRCEKNKELVDYYRGLICLRKYLAGWEEAFLGKGIKALSVNQMGQDVVSALMNYEEKSFYSQVICLFNASERETEIHLPEGNWVSLADGQSSEKWKNADVFCGKAAVAPLSARFFGKNRECHE